MFGEILQKFAERSPATVMVRALLEQLLNPEKLDQNGCRRWPGGWQQRGHGWTGSGAGLVGGGRLRASQGQQQGRQEGEAAGVGGDEVAHVAVLGWKRIGNL